MTTLSMFIVLSLQPAALSASLGWNLDGQAAAASGNLRAGASRIDITPADLTNLNSFNNGKFNSVHDPIFARVLVVGDDKTMAAFVALDLIEVGDTTEVRKRIQGELGIPYDHILITASHDHSAPRAGSVTPGGLAHGENKETDVYTKATYDKVLKALKQAKEAMQPARFGVGTGETDINVSRDQYTPGRGWGLGWNEDGLSDKTVGVLKFESTAGKPIAILFNYAVHSTATFNTAIVNGDLAGEAERITEQKIGGDVVALFTMGSGGDQIPKLTGDEGRPMPQRPRGAPAGPGDSKGGGEAQGGRPPQGGGGMPAPSPERIAAQFEATHVMGFTLASEVARVAAAIPDMTGTVRIHGSERIVTCPVKQGTAQMSDMQQKTAETMPLHLGLIQVNETALTGVSGEVVTRIYWHLKKVSPLRNTFMLTIANDRLGYIVDDASYDMPLFEVNGSPLARGCAEDAIVNNLTDMIKANQ